MINLGKVRPGSTIRFPFGSFAAATGAPSAVTNYADADILVYKDGGTTQRASAAGITATTTFDTLTGVNLCTIDLSDNTTADFWASGSEYIVVISDITVDTQTLRFPIARFVIGIEGEIFATTIATLASQTSFTLTAGSADNNAYIGCVCYVHDAASGIQCAMGVVSAYTGSTKTITLAVDPAIFTMAAKDNISIMPRTNVYQWNGLTTVALPLVPATAGRTLVVDAAGLADANMVKAGPTGSGTAQTARDIGGAVPAAAAGAFGGLLISGSNSGTTTLGALTVTGAMSINGTENVSQTGDSFARIGAAGASLTGITGAALSAAYDPAKTAAQAGDAMALTSAERNSTADALLARNVSGGSSAGRTVKQALHVLRNKTDFAAGTLTVYDTDDTTASFTAAVTTTAGDPISQIDPA
jgi:hypothetical protein